jgi:hypothetical protein
VTRMFPDGEVAVKLENVDDTTKPLLAHYRLNALRFAQVTGKRLLFQPIAFRRSQVYPFTATERRFGVEFPYAWKEIDQIHIQLPDGYTLDNADSPGSLNFGVTGSYNIKMTVTTGKNAELYTSRELTFGSDGRLYFEQKNYPALKQVFDDIEARDRHSISLKGN